MLFSCLKSFMACIALKRKYSLPRMVYKTTYDPANASLSAASLPSPHSNSSEFNLCSSHSGLIFLLVFLTCHIVPYVLAFAKVMPSIWNFVSFLLPHHPINFFIIFQISVHVIFSVKPYFHQLFSIGGFL